MTAGSMPKDKLKFIVDSAKKYHISKIHFTTCQAVQLHNLGYKALTELAEAGYDHGIITRGTGGDNPRNTMCSPLSGVEKGEYFDVMPYAKAAGEYALTTPPFTTLDLWQEVMESLMSIPLAVLAQIQEWAC